MRKIVLNIFLALIAFHVVMTILYFILLKGLIAYDKPIYNKFDLLFVDNSKQDILLLGSSRTYYGINPFLLEKLTGKKVVNAGLEGAKIQEMELTLKGYLFSHAKPEKLFLMLEPHSFESDNQSLYNKIYFSHYFYNDSLYQQFSDIIGYKAILWKWLPYSLISEFDDYTRLKCVKGIFSESQSDFSSFNYKGFSLLKRKYAASVSDFNVFKISIEKEEKALHNILAICASNQIDIHIIQGPYLKSFYERNSLQHFYKGINTNVAAKFPNVKIQVNPLNYDNTSYFKDETHMNDDGSTRYTLDLFTTFIAK